MAYRPQRSENAPRIQPPAKHMAGYQDTANKIFRTAPLTAQDATTGEMTIYRRGMEISVRPPPPKKYDPTYSQRTQAKKASHISHVTHSRSVNGNETTYDATYKPESTFGRQVKSEYKHTRRNASQINFQMGICDGYKNDVWESQTSRSHNHVPERYFVGFNNEGIARQYKHFVDGKQFEKTIYRKYGE